jgi:hypothetical protein
MFFGSFAGGQPRLSKNLPKFYAYSEEHEAEVVIPILKENWWVHV